MNSRKIVLASSSPRRKMLLEQMGLNFSIIVSDVDETVDQNLSPEDVVKQLAIKKAEAVAKQVKEPSIIIGADTIVVYNNKILGKPKDKQDAFNMLKSLQGEKHSVYTGVSIIDTNLNENNNYVISECADVWMSKLSDDEIANYINTSEPMDKAGAYAIQGKGSLYIENISGDYNTIVGLPINKIYKIFREKDFI